mmetsp:Transcript_29332/g.63628  ORF Transcript_29332/g.63628 Transcript_29332/m.63628 type:complete len:115 (+) Transcript_29332:1901-2245(+)
MESSGTTATTDFAEGRLLDRQSGVIDDSLGILVPPISHLVALVAVVVGGSNEASTTMSRTHELPVALEGSTLLQKLLGTPFDWSAGVDPNQYCACQNKALTSLTSRGDDELDED